MKKAAKGSPKLFHTPKSKTGAGDYHGTGIKNPTAIPREVMGVKVSGKTAKMSKPPRSLA